MNTQNITLAMVLVPALMMVGYSWSMFGLIQMFRAQFKGLEYADGALTAFLIVGFTVLTLYVFALVLNYFWGMPLKAY